jgi:hypothetical protein
MRHEIYEMTHPIHLEQTLDELRNIVHVKGGAGITIQGNRVTIRWGNPMRDVHMVLLSVNDGTKCPYCKKDHAEDDWCQAQAEAESK